MTDRELYPGVRVTTRAGYRRGQVGVVERLEGHRVLVRWPDDRLTLSLAVGLELVEDDEDTPVDSRVWEDES
ncbi:MAG: hypothetical protein ABH877_01035 [bacterium]